MSIGEDGRVLLAEGIVLVSLSPDGTLARGVMSQTAIGIAVTGALVADLVEAGHVTLPDGRVHLTGTRPTEPLLARTLDNLERHEGKRFKRRIGSIKHAGWKEVVDDMIDRGIVGRVKESMRPTRHPVTDPAAHAALLATVRRAATDDSDPPPWVADLLALAGPAQLINVVAPNRADRKSVRKRMAAAADRTPAMKSIVRAVRDAVTAATSSG
jgi:hypothetical protein